MLLATDFMRLVRIKYPYTICFISVFSLVFYLFKGPQKANFVDLQEAKAQADIVISNPTSGFPVAVPKLCDASGAAQVTGKIPQVVARDLQISGLFKVLNPSTFVETPGKCIAPEQVAYSDWSVIGAEGLVRGKVELVGDRIKVQLFLHDVQQKRVVIGKGYESSLNDFHKIAHRFANEVVGHFTGEKGVFGTQIAYVSRIGRFKELFVMDLDGSNVRQLTKDRGLAISPAWSPSGDKIVYTSYRSKRPELYFISPRGGNPKRLTKRKGLELGAEFSPDGTKLASAASVSGVSKLALFDLRGRMLKRLTSSSAIDVSPTWSPDGSQLAFCSNRAGGPQIYVMPSSGGAAKRISYTSSNYCTSPSWSPKGDKIAFVCRRNGHQVFIASPLGGESVQLTFAGSNEDPSWSPDGRFLTYSSDLGRGGPRNIVILSLLGGRPTKISFAKSEDSQPVWSPRGDL